MSSQTVSPNLENDIHTLKTIIDLNHDASGFYQLAQNKIQDVHLKTHFDRLDFIHRSVVKTLQDRMNLIGADYEERQVEQTLRGQAEKIFAQLLTTFSSDTEELFIKKLKDSEDRCLTTFQEAAQSKKVTPVTREILSRELQHVRNAHDSMTLLKELVETA